MTKEQLTHDEVDRLIVDKVRTIIHRGVVAIMSTGFVVAIGVTWWLSAQFHSYEDGIKENKTAVEYIRRDLNKNTLAIERLQSNSK